MSRSETAGTVTRPTPQQAATMATSGSARVAHALASAPLIHVRGPRSVGLARLAVATALLLALLAAVVAIWM